MMCTHSCRSNLSDLESRNRCDGEYHGLAWDDEKLAQPKCVDEEDQGEGRSAGSSLDRSSS